MSRVEDNMMFLNLSKIRVKCKNCGHTNTMPVFIDEKTCWFCKRIIHNNSNAYFKYKIRKMMGGEK